MRHTLVSDAAPGEVTFGGEEETALEVRAIAARSTGEESDSLPIK